MLAGLLPSRGLSEEPLFQPLVILAALDGPWLAAVSLGSLLCLHSAFSVHLCSTFPLLPRTPVTGLRVLPSRWQEVWFS